MCNYRVTCRFYIYCIMKTAWQRIEIVALSKSSIVNGKLNILIFKSLVVVLVVL